MRLPLAMILILSLAFPVAAESLREGTLYKSPHCTCCDGHAAYLQRNGIHLKIVETDDLSAIKKMHGVSPEFEGCHTILLEGYVIEGHVPITPIRRLLRERPAIRGISLPGMPLGSPGMSGNKERPFVIYEISAGEKRVYSTE
jgi:hypothetical protein